MRTRAPVLPACPPPGPPPPPPPPPPAPATVANTFDADGHLVERAEMRGGVLDGTTVFYAPDGREKGRARFRAGVLDGPVTLRDEEGRVWWSAAYRAGVPHGDACTWRAGTLVEKVPYVDGLRQGTALAWHPDGTRASSLPYVADGLEGTATWFSPRGRKTRSAAYRAGALEGESLDFHDSTPSEAVRTRSEYSGGVLHGALTHYDTDGRATMRTWFHRGEALGSVTCDRDTSALAPSAGGAAREPGPHMEVRAGTGGAAPVQGDPPAAGTAPLLASSVPSTITEDPEHLSSGPGPAPPGEAPRAKRSLLSRLLDGRLGLCGPVAAEDGQGAADFNPTERS